MDYSTFSWDELVLLGSNLQYFTCFKLLPGTSGRTAASLLLQFPNLKGFRCHSGCHRDYITSCNRELLQLNRPVCEIEREAAPSEETVKLLARGGTKCLKLPESWNGPLFSLPQSLAESLVGLSLRFEPTVKFCPFPLPNLLYLTVDCENADPSHHLRPIFSAPRLRCFTFKERAGSTSLSHLMRCINNFNELRVLSIDVRHDFGTEKQFALPKGLEKLTFKIRNFGLCPFDLPNLLYLTVDCEQADPSHHLRPIFSAPRLRCFTFKERAGSTSLSHLMRCINNFNELRVLSIDVRHDFGTEKQFALPKGLEKLTFKIRNFELCPFDLPNLLFLTVDCERWIPSPHPDASFSAPKLRCFTLKERTGSASLSYLVRCIDNFSELRVLSIEMDMEHHFGTEKKAILPKGLEKFTFKIKNFGLLEYSSPSTHSVVQDIIPFSLVCPSLKVLICDEFKLTPESMPGLLHSLSKCVTLVKLCLNSYIPVDNGCYVPLQPLIDLLSSMRQLNHLILIRPNDHLFFLDKPYEFKNCSVLSLIENQAYHGELAVHGSIDFDEKKFPSLRRLQLYLAYTEITLHLTSSFTICRPVRCVDFVELQNPDKNYSVAAHRVKCNEELDKLDLPRHC